MRNKSVEKINYASICPISEPLKKEGYILLTFVIPNWLFFLSSPDINFNTALEFALSQYNIINKYSLHQEKFANFGTPCMSRAWNVLLEA